MRIPADCSELANPYTLDVEGFHDRTRTCYGGLQLHHTPPNARREGLEPSRLYQLELDTFFRHLIPAHVSVDFHGLPTEEWTHIPVSARPYDILYRG